MAPLNDIYDAFSQEENLYELLKSSAPVRAASPVIQSVLEKMQAPPQTPYQPPPVPGSQGEVMGISPTPPEPGRNLLNPYIRGTKAFTERVDSQPDMFPTDVPGMLSAGSERYGGFLGAGIRPVGLEPSYSAMSLLRNPVDPKMAAVDTFDDLLTQGGKGIAQKMEQQGIPTRLNKPEDFMAVMRDNPNFKQLPVMERIRIASNAERIPREGTYAAEAQIAGSGNRKVGGSNIIPADTIRGCGNKCYNCYALGGANQACIEHATPVKATLTGKIPAGKVLRIGETGDPATDWAHSNDQIHQILARSPGAVPQKSVFAITKLQNVDGIDTSVWRNLEISVDPLDTVQMNTTLANIGKLQQMDPSVNMTLRIRTLVSRDPEISGNVAKAIEFAKSNNMNVLETRLRFKNKFAFELLDLDESAYMKEGPQYKLRQPLLTRDQGLKVKLCGENGGKCATCRNCEKLMTKTAPDNGQSVREKNYGPWVR